MSVENSLPDLCELVVSFVEHPDSSNTLQCLVDLRVSSSEIPLGDEECEVSFRRLILSIANEGMKVKPGSRFGEPRKNNAVSKQRQVSKSNESSRSRQWKIGGKSSGKPEGEVGLGGCKNDTTLSLETANEEEPHIRVKARPNDKWEISEYENEVLDGTYLEEHTLFEAELTQQANRVATTIELKVKQRDLAINQIMRNESAVSFFSKLSENQRRLVDIFIAKSLSNSVYGDRKYIGEIILSSYEFEYES